MSEKLDLDGLERLAKAATPGPWEWWTSNSFLRLTGRQQQGGAHGQDGGVLSGAKLSDGCATVVASNSDREFIASARSAVPALIDRVRELESEKRDWIAANAPGGWIDDLRRASQPGGGDDTKRLDALRDESWDVRSFCIGEEDIGWRVIEFHQAAPHERVVAEVFKDDPRAAIDAARAATGAGNGEGA